MYDQTSPYDTRWPRPGPAMVLVAALVGLIGGIIFGLAASAFSGPSSKASASADTTTSTTTTLPNPFYTVIVASIPRDQPRSVVAARVQNLAAEGYKELGILDPHQYSSLNQRFWGIYSGVFSTWAQAQSRQRQLAGQFPDHPRPYPGKISR